MFWKHTKCIIAFQFSFNLGHSLTFWNTVKTYKYVSLVRSVFTPTETFPLIFCPSPSRAICSCCSLRYRLSACVCVRVCRRRSTHTCCWSVHLLSNPSCCCAALLELPEPSTLRRASWSSAAVGATWWQVTCHVCDGLAKCPMGVILWKSAEAAGANMSDLWWVFYR